MTSYADTPNKVSLGSTVLRYLVKVPEYVPISPGVLVGCLLTISLWTWWTTGGPGGPGGQ